MNKELEKRLEVEFKQRFREMHTEGVKQGAKAICHAILEKAKNESKTYEQRIVDIVQFCTIGLGVDNEV